MHTDDVLKQALDECSRSAWQATIDAVPQRMARALEEAAHRLEPDKPAKTVSVRRGTLTDKAAVREWLAEHEKMLTEAVASGPVIVR